MRHSAQAFRKAAHLATEKEAAGTEAPRARCTGHPSSEPALSPHYHGDSQVQGSTEKAIQFTWLLAWYSPLGRDWMKP